MSSIGGLIRILRWAGKAGTVAVGASMIICGVKGPYWGVAPGVTPATIRALAPGMSWEEVVTILGVPLQVQPWGPRASLLTYAHPHSLAPWSSSLWVFVDEGRVTAVGAKRYPLIGDDRGVYGFAAGYPRDGQPWESVEFETTFRPTGTRGHGRALVLTALTSALVLLVLWLRGHWDRNVVLTLGLVALLGYSVGTDDKGHAFAGLGAVLMLNTMWPSPREPDDSGFRLRRRVSWLIRAALGTMLLAWTVL